MTVLLIDGNSLMHRAFHADKDKTTRSDGLPTGGVTEFIMIIWYLLRSRMRDYEIDYGLFAFDCHGPNWRHDIFPDYKGNRPPKPEGMNAQFVLMRHAASLFGMDVCQEQNYEADDLIATYTRLATENGIPVVIVTADKDLFQLVDDDARVRVYNHMAKAPPPENDPYAIRYGVMFDEGEVEKKFGVPPRLLGDLLALKGDSSDNLPGVPGIGDKRGSELLHLYGSLERLLENADCVPQAKARAALQEHADTVREVRQLIELERYAAVTVDIEAIRPINYDELFAFMKILGMRHSLEALAGEVHYDLDEILLNPDHDEIIEKAWDRM